MLPNSSESSIDRLCRNMPMDVARKIPRDHLVELILRALEIKTNAVLVIGEPLSGKSALAADLYYTAPKSSIGVFLGTDSYSRSKEYIQLTVAEQISWITENKPLSLDAIGETDYRRLIFALQKHSRQQKITWIIDGLTTSSADSKFLEDIISTLTLSFREFDFIFMAEEDIPSHLGSCHRTPKTVDLISVSPDEARAYFSDLLKDESDISEVRAMCSGVVGHMAMIRSLLEDGASIDSVVSKQNNSIAALLETAWKNISPHGELAKLIAQVIFSDRPVSLIVLATRLDLDEHSVTELITNSKIIEIKHDVHGQFAAVRSKAQLEIAKIKLAHHESQIRKGIIDELLSAIDSKESVRYLPKNLAGAGQHRQLVTSLDSSHFVRLLQIEQTLKSLKQHAEYGRDAGRSLGDPHIEISFCLLISMLTGLKLAVGRIEQIDALTRLGLHEVALEIAVIAPTAEERLHLLSRAVNGLDAKDYPISETIRTQIAILAEEVGGEDLGELGIDIACDLLSIDVKLADSFLTRVTEGASKRSNLQHGKSIRQVDASNSDSAIEKKSSQILGGRPGNFEVPPHKRQQFWREATRRLKKLKPEGLLRKLADEEAGFSLLMCTTWLTGNRKNPDAVKVAEAALDFMLENSERTPRVLDLIEIARILPYIEDTTRREGLCYRLETQFRVLGHLGTTADSVKLRMQFYRSRHLGDNLEVVELALIDLFVEIQELTDLSTKATCWAWMLYHLSLFENSIEMEKRTEIAHLTSQQLQQSLDLLLRSAADHFKVAENALTALSRFKPKLAMDVIAKLNTAHSRDNALETLVRSLLSRHATEAVNLVAAIEKIEDVPLRSRVIVNTLLSIRRSKENGEDESSPAPELLDLWRRVDIEIFKFQAILVTLAYQIELSNEVQAKLLAEEAEKIWNSRPLDHTKIELGYLAARELADVDKKAATEWISRTDLLLTDSAVGSAAANEALQRAIGLATRLLPTLIISDGLDDTKVNLNRIQHLLNAMPLPESQVGFWSALVVRIHFAGNHERAKMIADEYLQPALTGADHADRCTRDAMTAHTSAACYLVHSASALHRIDSMESLDLQDMARSNIIKTILQRTPHWEPFSEDKEVEYLLEPTSVADILSVLKGCKRDSLIFEIICDMCRSLTSQSNRGRLQRNFVIDTLRGLQEFVSRALPDQRNIKHDGYAIACEAHIKSASSKILQNTATEDSAAWSGLYSRARGIPNVSDRAIVTAFVGVNARIGPSSPLKSWIQDIKNDLIAIPAAHDRIDRYKWVARILQARDKLAAKSLISDAIAITSGAGTTDDAIKQQQQLLDLAHIIDPELAQTLLDGLDVDEARKGALKKRLETNASKKVIAAKPDATDLKDLEIEQVAEICYSNLGSLLANRINAKPITDFLELAAKAQYTSIHDSAPIWEWMFENVAKRQLTGAKQVDQTPRKLFNAVCKAAEISQGLMGRMNGAQHQIRSSSEDVFGVGDRDQFLKRVGQWAASQNGQSIIITDPYFSPTDIGFLQAMTRAAPDSAFKILTSREQIRKIKLESPEDGFLDAWQDISDLAPPRVRFGIIGYGSAGKHPIHDRWLVSESAGIRLGSSINSIGLSRISDLSEMSDVDASARRQTLEKYLDSPPRLFGEERLTVTYFDLR